MYLVCYFGDIYHGPESDGIFSYISLLSRRKSIFVANNEYLSKWRKSPIQSYGLIIYLGKESDLYINLS